MTLVPNSVGETLREIRLARGLSLRKLGKLCGVSAPHLSDIEHGRRRPSPTLFGKLKTVLAFKTRLVTRTVTVQQFVIDL